MRREPAIGLLITAVVCLVIGAVVTTGSAWALALRGTVARDPLQGMPSCIPYPVKDAPAWAARGLRNTRGGFQPHRFMGFGLEDTCLSVHELTAIPEGVDPGPGAVSGLPYVLKTGTVVLHRAGWPLPAFVCVAAEGAAVRRGVKGGIRAATWAARETYSRDYSMYGRPPLPVRPEPLGFAVNTALYAALVGAAWLGPGPARRALRRRRGHCLGCGYSRAGLAPAAVCPECGSEDP